MPKHPYHNLSTAEKEAYSRAHEPPTRCEGCEMAIQPDDLLAHVDKRCEGRSEPHPRSRWITRASAIKIGVSGSTLSDWGRNGIVRYRGKARARRYMLRDLTKAVAARRRTTTNRRQGKRGANRLTKQRGNANRLAMEPISVELAIRLRAYCVTVGGFAAAGRKLDIPSDTLRRAANGEKVRRGTAALISVELDAQKRTK